MKRRARYRKDTSPSLPLHLTQRGVIVIGVALLVLSILVTAAFTAARNSAQTALEQAIAKNSAASQATAADPQTGAASSSSTTDSGTESPAASASEHAEGGPDSTFDASQVHASADPLLVLVRKDLPLEPKEFKPQNLVSLAPGKTLVKEAADHFQELLNAAAQAGHSLRLESGYRSYNAQANLFRRYSNKYGAAYAEKISARPGTSEHQTGLAADIGYSNGQCSLHRCFGETPGGQWVADHAAEFGFIVRYPQDKVAVTGYNFEPWHLRYIGVENARIYVESGKGSLEEFLNTL